MPHANCKKQGTTPSAPSPCSWALLFLPSIFYLHFHRDFYFQDTFFFLFVICLRNYGMYNLLYPKLLSLSEHYRQPMRNLLIQLIWMDLALRMFLSSFIKFLLLHLSKAIFLTCFFSAGTCPDWQLNKLYMNI